MAQQFFDFVLRYLPGYALVMAAMLAPLLIVIVVWKTMDFLADRLGDRALYAIQVNRRFKRMGEHTTREELLHSMRTLDPTEFEYYIASIFRNAGFTAKVTGRPGEPDGGIDIVLSKNGSNYFVQCKKFIGKDISVGTVRDFYGAIADPYNHIPSREDIERTQLAVWALLKDIVMSTELGIEVVTVPTVSQVFH